MKKILLLAGIVIAMLALPVLSHAMSVHIVNPSFEDNVYSDGYWWDHEISGWTVNDIPYVTVAGVLNPTISMFPSGIPDGENVAFVNNGSSIYQQLDYLVRPNTQLTLSVDIGARIDISNLPLPAYEIQLLAGDTLLASSSMPILNDYDNFITSQAIYTVSDSDPLIGTPVGIRLLNTSTVRSQVDFDNVRLSNDDLIPDRVPEPSSLIVMGSGMVMFAGLRRKFKK